MIKRNQLNVIFNQYQGDTRRVLTVCSAGCLRSPTAAHILASPPFNFNTRCCGLETEYAIIPISDALVVWADTIVVMERRMVEPIEDMLVEINNKQNIKESAEIIVLDVEDNYEYRNPELVNILTSKFTELFL